MQQSNQPIEVSCTLHGVVTVEALVKQLHASAQFGNLQDAAFEEAVRRNLQELGLALQSDFFWRMVQDVLANALHQDYYTALITTNNCTHEHAARAAEHMERDLRKVCEIFQSLSDNVSEAQGLYGSQRDFRRRFSSMRSQLSEIEESQNDRDSHRVARKLDFRTATSSKRERTSSIMPMHRDSSAMQSKNKAGMCADAGDGLLDRLALKELKGRLE